MPVTLIFVPIVPRVSWTYGAEVVLHLEREVEAGRGRPPHQEPAALRDRLGADHRQARPPALHQRLSLTTALHRPKHCTSYFGFTSDTA